MATNKPLLKSYIKQELYNKLKILATKENRSVSNLVETILEKSIREYEKQHGNINVGDINITGGTNNIDIG